MRRRPAAALAAVSLLAAVPAGLRAQVHAEFAHDARVTASLGVYSAYVWRGLHVTNRPVLQPDLAVGAPALGVHWHASVWGNIESSEPADNALVLGGVHGGIDLSEVDVQVEGARAFGRFTVTAGALGFLFPNGWGTTSEENTVELFGRVTWQGPVFLKAGWYQDVGVVDGAYAEAGIDVPLRRMPLPLTVGVLAGLNMGQGPSHEAEQVAYFATTGLTHLDFSASTSFLFGGVRVSPVGHLVYGEDEEVRFTGAHTTAHWKGWFGVSLNWFTPFGRSPSVHHAASGEHAESDAAAGH